MFKQILLYSKQNFFITVLDVALYFTWESRLVVKNIIKLIRPASEKKVKFVIAAMKRRRKKSH